MQLLESCEDPEMPLVRPPRDETVNVIDLVLCEATPNEHVVSTPVWISPNTSFHYI